MSDWDATQYHRLAEPQTAWGAKVLNRLKPAAGERILDIGCGTGRLTLAAVERTASATFVATDRSSAMVREARRTLPMAVGVVQADGVHLPLAPVFDAVFSTATFHWIKDHEALFLEIHRILRPGGRLVSQAGGGPNLARLYERTARLAREGPFTDRFTGWRDPWHFAGVSETEDRLRAAGFAACDVWLEQALTSFADAAAYRAFVTTVCLRHQLDRLESGSRERYLDRIVEWAAEDTPAFTLDYWRLNIDARKR